MINQEYFENKFTPENWSDITKLSDSDDLSAVVQKINEVIDHVNFLAALIIGINQK